MENKFKVKYYYIIDLNCLTCDEFKLKNTEKMLQLC